MTPLGQAIQDYLALRRRLGFKLRDAGLCLVKFAAFMEARDAPHITTALALEWIRQSPSVTPATWAQRLGYVRGFARHHAASDPQTEVPPAGLLPFRPRRARPYLYSDEDIAQLLRSALDLPPAGGLRPWTYHTLLGLLSVAGLRVGEAIRLMDADVDLQEGLLTIRGTKFGKSRLVPIHSSTLEVLQQYRAHREPFLAGHAPRHSSSPVAVIISTSVMCIERSIACRAKSDCAARPPATVRACTTFGTASRSRRCCAGTARARMSSDGCRCCRPIWAMPMSPTPTGI